MATPDAEALQELFREFGRISVRRMFGGAGIFFDGLMIALVTGGEIYLKADAETAPSFEREGMKPFSYGAKRKRVVMSYWRMPDRLMDDPDELAGWARAALGAARRSAIVKRGKSGPSRTKQPSRRGAK